MLTNNYQTILLRLLSIFFLLLLISAKAHADFITEIYGGVDFTRAHNAKVNLPDARISGTHFALKFDNAATVGGRAAYWFDSFQYLGLGVDVSHFFGPDQKNQVSMTELCIAGSSCSTAPETIKKFKNNVTAIGLDVMLRYPLLVSEQFNKGKIQPFISIGPAIFLTTLTDTDNFIPPGQSSKDTALGVKVGTGIMVFLTPNIGTFLEYRDTKFSVNDTYYNARVVHGITLGKTLGNAIFNIQAIVAGAIWHF